jgi:hypothetical protein
MCVLIRDIYALEDEKRPAATTSICGRLSFAVPESVTRGELRPLRIRFVLQCRSGQC